MNKVLIFDFDGTLADSFDTSKKIVGEIFEQYRLPRIKTNADLERLFDGNFFENTIKFGLDRKLLSIFINDLKDKLEKNRDDIRLFPKTIQLLEKIKDDNIIVVITSNMTDLVEYIFSKYRVTCITEVLGADKEISKIKKIYHIINKFPDKEYYLIGDTTGDILEGKKAGVKTIAVDWGYHSHAILRKVKPDFLVSNYDDLAEILEGRGRRSKKLKVKGQK